MMNIRHHPHHARRRIFSKILTRNIIPIVYTRRTSSSSPLKNFRSSSLFSPSPNESCQSIPDLITEISEGGETAENQGEIGFDARPNEKAFVCVGDFQVCHAGDGSGNDECAENENRNEAESVGAGDGESVENSYRKDIDLK